MVVRHSRRRHKHPVFRRVILALHVAENCIQHGGSIGFRCGTRSHTHTGHRHSLSSHWHTGYHLPLPNLCSTPQCSRIPLPTAQLRKSKRVSHGGTGNQERLGRTWPNKKCTRACAARGSHEILNHHFRPKKKTSHCDYAVTFWGSGTMRCPRSLMLPV